MALLLAVLALNSPAAADSLKLSAEPVQLDKTDLDRKSVGKLMWRGGLVLTSLDGNFKELSALLVSDDGSRLTSVTDTGYWITMGLDYDQDGHLSDVTDGKIGLLLGLDRKPLAKEKDGIWDKDKVGDAESLARLDNGSLVVAFERNHRLWRYSPGIDATAAKHPEPPQFKKLTRGSNEGVEALVTLANGALLAFVEGLENTEKSLAYIQDHGKWKRLSYQHDIGFRPTGATRLPNGDVLVIERCFNFEPCDGNRTIIRLHRLKAASIVPGAELKGEKVAELKDPFIVDNLEGVAVRVAGGETLVYLLSDNNGKHPSIQRTLLLMFALKE